MNRAVLCKSRPKFSLANHTANVFQTYKTERVEKQREHFWGSRIHLDSPVSPKPKPLEKKKNTRAEMLQKWKAEKMKKLEEERKKRKPAFKAGVLQRKANGSPVLAKTLNKQNFEKHKINKETLKENSTTKKYEVITRAKFRSMEVKPKFHELNTATRGQTVHSKCYKVEKGERKKIDSYVFKVPEVVAQLPSCCLTFPSTPRVLRMAQADKKSHKKEINLGISKAEVEIETKSVGTGELIKKKIVQRESQVKNSSEEKENQEVHLVIKTPQKTEIQTDDYRPIYYSPYVTKRTGKKSKSLVFDIDEEIKKDENEFKCRIFSFRKYLECETKRLLEMCNKWKHILEDTSGIPTEVEGDISSVIGRTTLLTSDKFIQFKGLIDNCENGDPLVKVDDLQGFQDWISLEVDKMNEEFHKIEKMKCNDWKPETLSTEDAQKPKPNVVKKAKKKPVGKSQIRSHILAARKLLKEGNANCGEESKLPVFELGVKATTPKKKESLLKDILNLEKKSKNELSLKKSPFVQERRNSGLEIMTASRKFKFSTPVQRSPLRDCEIIGGFETPSKSILKKTPKKLNSSQVHVTFENQLEISSKRKRGLSERYFQPLTDENEANSFLCDSICTTPRGMNTRSMKRKFSIIYNNNKK